MFMTDIWLSADVLHDCFSFSSSVHTLACHTLSCFKMPQLLTDDKLHERNSCIRHALSPLCMCVCVRETERVTKPVCVHARMCLCRCVCARRCACTCVCVHACMCVCVCVCVCVCRHSTGFVLSVLGTDDITESGLT